MTRPVSWSNRVWLNPAETLMIGIRASGMLHCPNWFPPKAIARPSLWRRTVWQLPADTMTGVGRAQWLWFGTAAAMLASTCQVWYSLVNRVWHDSMEYVPFWAGEMIHKETKFSHDWLTNQSMSVFVGNVGGPCQLRYIQHIFYC